MKKLRLTSQFKKDLKRYKYRPKSISALEMVLGYLTREETIPKQYKPHLLSGNYRGYMECHVENDLLLIWLDPDSDTITLVRLGTHSEIF